jgi:hypothetical protein
MIEGSFPRFADGRDNYRQSFLDSHRALSACARELTRLTEEIAVGVEALSDVAVDHKAVVRQSPDRCIVQLGPVALTLAWLRGGLESVAAGELLVIVWRGAVAPRTQHQPERPSARRLPLPATPLWEQVLTAVADNESSWGWQSIRADVGPYSSSELAARCVERLRAAYVASGDAEPSP